MKNNSLITQFFNILLYTAGILMVLYAEKIFCDNERGPLSGPIFLLIIIMTDIIGMIDAAFMIAVFNLPKKNFLNYTAAFTVPYLFLFMSEQEYSIYLNVTVFFLGNILFSFLMLWFHNKHTLINTVISSVFTMLAGYICFSMLFSYLRF